MTASCPLRAAPIRPRLGFLGVGWIGRHRMQAILDAGLAEVVAIADPSPGMLAEAARLAPGAARVPTLDAMLDAGVEGVVIATPSALHAGQSIRALERGAAVFCQKPLGRTAAEARAVVAAARAADRLFAVDLSYRCTEAMRRIRDLVLTGGLGRDQGRLVVEAGHDHDPQAGPARARGPGQLDPGRPPQGQVADQGVGRPALEHRQGLGGVGGGHHLGGAGEGPHHQVAVVQLVVDDQDARRRTVSHRRPRRRGPRPVILARPRAAPGPRPAAAPPRRRSGRAPGS